jgi:hypothetical protein
VSGTPSGGYPADWLASRMPDKRMDRVLTELRLEDIYDLFGHYLAGSRELGEFASGAPINRDDHPYVIFQAPHFAYNDPQPVYVRLLKLVDRFRPDPAEVLAAQSGAAVNLNYPKIAQHDCSDSRLGKGRIAILCNPYRNAEAGQSGKQDGIIYFFRGPKFPPWSEWPIKPGSSRLALLSQWLSSCLGGRC